MGEWLVRIPANVTSEGEVALGSTAFVALENFGERRWGVLTGLAGLSRPYPYGRALGDMEVVDYAPNSKLTLWCGGSPVKFRVSLSIRSTGRNTRLNYAEEVCGLSPGLTVTLVVVSPLVIPLAMVLQLARLSLDGLFDVASGERQGRDVSEGI